jgi:tRNA-splicing endonuclease subunit Sen34
LSEDGEDGALRRSGEDGALLWSYPRNDSQRRKCAVFAHLHARGLTLTSGAKFGAEYLAYPGDPAAYHASFTVRVMAGARDDGFGTPRKTSSGADAESPEEGDQTISLLSLVAATRMSHGARKHCVFAGARRRDRSRAAADEGWVEDGDSGVALRALGEWVVTCVTAMPDVEQSRQRKGRVS